jgi:hypothetical protein
MTLASPRGDLVVRRLETTDVDGLGALYAGLGARDRHRRFFAQFTPRREWIATWIARCTGEGDGLVAVDPAGRVVGEAGYVRREDGDGEFSLTVDEAWRGWLGGFLLDVLVELAAARGVPNLVADVLTENAPMRALARRRDAVVSGESDLCVQHVVIGTTRGAATWPATRRAGSTGRVLVEAPGGHWSAGPDATAAGYDVLGCAGPSRRSGAPCPMRDDGRCPLASGADVIVVAVPDDEERAWLVGRHAELHPEVPVLVVGGAPDATPSAACRLAAGSPAAALVDALGRAPGLASGRRGVGSARQPRERTTDVESVDPDHVDGRRGGCDA